MKKYTEMNREAWNEVEPYHVQGRKENLEEKMKDSKCLWLNEVEIATFKNIGLAGKKVIQLCCNNGIELISIIRLGANQGLGIDISDEFIKDAKKYSQIAKVNCEFLRSDVYELNFKTLGSFDILYLSVGALCWMPDLSKFFTICSKLIKPNGHIFIFDTHPFANMLGVEGESGYNEKFPMNPVHSYFKSDPFIETDGIDYIGGKTYESKPSASFSYKISDIMNNLIQNNIEILEFKEYQEDIATVYSDVKDFKIIPLGFSLLGKKKEIIKEKI